MGIISAIFSPNRVISRRVFIALAAVQGAALLVVWLTWPSGLLPTPAEVIASFGDLWTNEALAHELWSSFLLNLAALVVATLISLSLSYLSTLPIVRPIALFITKGRFLGLIGLTFVFTLLSSGSHSLKVMLLVFGVTVFMTTSMSAVVAAIPSEKLDHARTLRMSEWRIVWEVVIRGTFADAIEALRQNAAIGWMMLTMVEGIARSEGGVGALLLNQNKHFHLSAVFAIQITILVVGLVQDYGIGVFKRVACPYAFLRIEHR